ncbi:MAG: FAD-dependent oxidoreductase [Chitinophagales bacterium]|nr:FAD-dependent oxidoreductase [Chitinophagales bacterium]
MRNWLRKKIKDKLQGYRIQNNTVNDQLPLNVAPQKTVAIIGGGIAGLSSAANLAERGFKVTLFEKNDYLGGKLGSWTFDSNGETLRTEHGFHAFFRQYYNLRNFMKRLDIYKHLIPIDDYIIFYENGKQQGFAGIDQTPGLNIWDLRKKGILDFWTFVNPLSIQYLKLLRYHPNKTFKKYDTVSFASFAKKTMMPEHLKLVFNSFARAFFSEPEKMSMAELMKGFHFYFLSNEDGLLYDVLDDDFEYTFLRPVEQYILQNQGVICRNTSIDNISMKDNKFVVNDHTFDYCIWAADVKHTKRVLSEAAFTEGYPHFRKQMLQLNASDRYAVLRIWTDRFEKNPDLPFFLFTDRLQCLDSITFYHKMEKESKKWSEQHHGGIFELHAYTLPAHLTDDAAIQQQLLDEMFHYLPELKGLTIKHKFFQHRDDFPAFQLGNYKNRPTIQTEIPNFFLAGDWVKLPTTAMLMEAAYTSGAIAANHILSTEGLQEYPLESVCNEGLFA